MVKRVFKLVYGEIRGLHQAAYLLAFFAIGSQMLALVRDRLLAHTFGAGTELDLYYTAFRIPDLMFALFSSVLSVYVLLPFVTRARADSGAQAGAMILSQMFTLFVVVYTGVAIVLFAFAPMIVERMFPGFAEESALLTLLLRILLLQPFFLGLSSLYGVVTQLSQRFALYAISPLVYNIGIIIGVAWLYPVMGLSGLAVGVVIGAMGHLLIQLPLVEKSELAFSFVRNIDWGQIISVLKVALPRALTLSIHQIVLLVLISLATLMTVGSVSVFQFAFNLQSVPLAIIGMSYSVAAFPVLAELFAKQHREAFLMHITTAVRHMIFWSVPIIALVIVLRAHIVRVVLGSGEFSWSDTRLTAAILALFVTSLLFQSLILLMVRAFYAGGNTRTPLLIALLGAAISLLSAVSLVAVFDLSPKLQEWLSALFRLEGVAGTEVLLLVVSYVVGVILETVLLFIFASRQFGLSVMPLARQFGEGLLAAFTAGVLAYGTLIFIVDGINQETLIGILLQGVVAGMVGVAGAILMYYGLGSRELQEIYGSFRTKLLKTDVIAPQSETL
jgi:putative peptidoglycan lipid II flippase